MMKEKPMQKAFATKIVRLGAVLFASAALAIAAQAQTEGGMGMMQHGGGMQGCGMMQHGGTMGSSQSQPDGTQGGMMGGMMQHGAGMQGCGTMQHGGTMENCPMGGGTPAYTEGRLAFFKAYLAISDQQKAAWEAYASALKSNLEGIKGIRDTKMKAMQAKSPTGRLDAHIAALEAMAATLKELRPALTALYTALSDEQKKKADELLSDVGCMM
jgi:hypothetical protein